MKCILDRNKLTSVEIASGFIAHLGLILLWIIDHIVNRGSHSPRIPFCKYISEIFFSTVTTFLIIFYILIKLYSLWFPFFLCCDSPFLSHFCNGWGYFAIRLKASLAYRGKFILLYRHMPLVRSINHEMDWELKFLLADIIFLAVITYSY